MLAVQAELAGLDTQNRELDRQASLHKREGEKLQGFREDLLDRRKEIQKVKPDRIYTNHYSDLNVDHKVVFNA